MARIGNSDIDVSPLCLGGNVFGWTADEATSFAVLDAYVAGGGNFVDTADSYGNQPRFDRTGVPPADQRASAEGILGAALAGRRHEAVIATKVMEPVGSGPNDRGLSRTHIL